MGMIAESLINILHIACSAGEDNASHELVCELFWHLMPDILYDFLHTSLYQLNEFTALHLTFIVDIVTDRSINLIVISVCGSVAELHYLSIRFLHLQRSYVLSDVVASQWDNCHMTKDILVEYQYGGSLGSHIHEHTARALFCIGEDAVSEGYRSEIHLCYLHSCTVKAVVQTVIVLLSLQDIQEIAFKM